MFPPGIPGRKTRVQILRDVAIAQQAWANADLSLWSGMLGVFRGDRQFSLAGMETNELFLTILSIIRSKCLNRLCT